MGLVSTYKHRGIQRYAAENPAKLKSYFEEKMILAERLAPILQKEIEEGAKAVNIRFYDDEPSTNQKLHQVKHLPKNFDFPGYIQIYDDKVSVFL